MKKSFFLIASVAIFAIVSCKKSSSSTTVTPTPSSGFVWTEDGGANITADSAFFIFGTGGSSQSYVNAYKIGGTPKKFFEINLSNNTASTYNIPSQGDFIYWKDTTANMGSGTVTVTSNSGGKASGSFNITLSGGSVTTIKGTFTNITVK